MRTLLHANGTPRAISGNDPLLLNQTDQVYLVTADNVDVFAVPLRDGRSQGVRRFLFRAEQNELLFGMPATESEAELGLLVTGKPGSSVIAAPKSLLAQAALDPAQSQELLELVNVWIANLHRSLGQGLPPRETELLTPGRWSLSSGKHARPQSGQKHLWVCHLEGQSQLYSVPHWPLSSANGFLPLSEQAWLTAREDISLQCLSPKDYQDTDPKYTGLDAFHTFFLGCVADQQTELENQEKQRQKQMRRRDEARIASTMSLLAESMETGDQVLPAHGGSQDELLTACVRVGREIGVEIQEPAPEDRINTDPLQAIAKGSNVRLRQVALKGQWWKTDGGPMLGFLQEPDTDVKRPVALLQPSPGRYVLEDPRTGKQRKIDKKVNAELSLFGYVFYRPLPQRPLGAVDLLRFALYGLGRDRAMLILMAAAAAMLGLLPPIATGIIFDTLIPEANRMGVLYIGSILISASIATGLFQVAKMFSTMRLLGKMDFWLQAGIMDRLLSMPIPFFRDYTAGDLADRTMGINAIREILSGTTLSSIMGGIFSIFSLGLLFYYSWRLALVAMAITLISVFILAWIGYAQIRYQRDISHLQGKLQGMVLQFISGISKLRISGTEDRAFAAWAERFSAMRKLTFRSTKSNNHLQAFTAALPAFSLLIIFGWIAFTSLIQDLSVGNIVAFNSAFTQFQTALTQLALTLSSSLQVVPLYERAQPILKTKPEVDMHKADPGLLTGHMEANNISFRYEPEGPLILQDVSMEVHPGEFAAIVGGSGSGKSTLLRLLLCFERPESGTIYYDSQDLEKLDVVAVRRQLGVVLQNGAVRPGDIFSNIVGSGSVSQDDA
ncbi:MAG: ABC transporter transmembrane domain-containing protein, partial [Desulfovermiculus sp.]